MKSYFNVSDALAIDDSIDENSIQKNLDILNLNSPEDIINWMNPSKKGINARDIKNMKESARRIKYLVKLEIQVNLK